MTYPIPESITFDTCILSRPVERRFVMATWELLGTSVSVLPHVTNELHGVLFDNEFLHWHSSLASQERREHARYAPGKKDRIATAAAQGARQWVERELQAEHHATDGPPPPRALRTVPMSALQRERANGIAAAIPGSCFRGASKDGHFGDRTIIAQAIVMDFSILATRNRGSIRRHQVNEWAKASMGLNDQLALGAEDAVQQVQERILSPSDKASLAAVLLACLPGRPVTPERTSAIVERFLSLLQKSSFANCGEGAALIWQEPEGLALAAQITRRLKDSATRQTEQRRVDLVRQQATHAGWSPSR